MSKILITGAAGFIGSNLVEHCLEEGFEVVALDNLENGLSSNLEFATRPEWAGQYKFIKGDIRNLEDCQHAAQGVDYILHQAALGSVPRSLKDPVLYHENNGLGTLHMLVAARDQGVKLLVYASSSSVYGNTPTLPKIETMSPNPISPYAISKLTNELYAKTFTDQYGLPTIGLRYFNVFGPRQNPKSQYAAVIPKFVTAYLNDQPPDIYGDGEQTRDFTYIKNVVHANLASLNSPQEAWGRAYNIGCGQNISLKTLAHKIQQLTDGQHTPNFCPPRPGDVQDSLADITAAQTYLNYQVQTSLDDGLSQTIDWYRCLKPA